MNRNNIKLNTEYFRLQTIFYQLEGLLDNAESHWQLVYTLFWRRKWQPTPVLLPGKFHGWRSLVGYSPWGWRVRHDWVTSLSLFTFIHFLFITIAIISWLFFFLSVRSFAQWIYAFNLFYPHPNLHIGISDSHFAEEKIQANEVQ